MSCSPSHECLLTRRNDSVGRGLMASGKVALAPLVSGPRVRRLACTTCALGRHVLHDHRQRESDCFGGQHQDVHPHLFLLPCTAVAALGFSQWEEARILRDDSLQPRTARFWHALARPRSRLRLSLPRECCIACTSLHICCTSAVCVCRNSSARRKRRREHDAKLTLVRLLSAQDSSTRR